MYVSGHRSHWRKKRHTPPQYLPVCDTVERKNFTLNLCFSVSVLVRDSRSTWESLADDRAPPLPVRGGDTYLSSRRRSEERHERERCRSRPRSGTVYGLVIYEQLSSSLTLLCFYLGSKLSSSSKAGEGDTPGKCPSDTGPAEGGRSDRVGLGVSTYKYTCPSVSVAPPHHAVSS